jgi:hypothetical protein
MAFAPSFFFVSVPSIEPRYRRADDLDHVPDSLPDALPLIPGPAVAELQGLALARGRSARHDGAAHGPALQDHIRFDRWISPGVQHFPCKDVDDLAHASSSPLFEISPVQFEMDLLLTVPI